MTAGYPDSCKSCDVFHCQTGGHHCYWPPSKATWRLYVNYYVMAAVWITSTLMPWLRSLSPSLTITTISSGYFWLVAPTQTKSDYRSGRLIDLVRPIHLTHGANKILAAVTTVDESMQRAQRSSRSFRSIKGSGQLSISVNHGMFFTNW